MEDARPYDEWCSVVEDRLRSADLRPLEAARQALRQLPDDGYILELAAFAALVEDQPELAIRYIKKLDRNYYPGASVYACLAFAEAQLGRWPIAKGLIEKHVFGKFGRLTFPRGLNHRWADSRLRAIALWQPKRVEARRPRKSQPASQTSAPAPSAVPELPRFPAEIPVRFVMPVEAAYLPAGRDADAADFLLRLDLAHLALLQQYDELLCLPHLRGVTHYLYQVETVRKVLKQFRGRVLLADEVGLGKTIEAGMVLKEYLLRGMAQRVLILTPPSLVGQWQEEMEAKFGLRFASTHDALLRSDPARFWAQPLVIASIATARREPHCEILSGHTYDIVAADEAHHLKNRSSKNWKLVDGLKRRFLLLLSATPVQNNLIELYNLLTLLKPGIFKTEKEFRSLYVSPENPRIPANRERLHDLMRDVMVRNTRALVDVKLPPRHAVTLRLEPAAAEQECYLELSRLIRTIPDDWRREHHLALRYLLEAAGSSPRAAASSLARFLEHDPPGEWRALHTCHAQLGPGSKAAALLELLARNPKEKKLVFVRFRDTLRLLADALGRNAIRYAEFEGEMTGQEKDAAIEQFRADVPVLLCTETGGEGRNVQFCPTIVNYDLPWNPQLIEQRIGRIHRIGQARDVYVFNLALRNTLEDHILRILDEKINMFELVVGEIQSILGEMAEDREFAQAVFDAWLEQTEEGRRSAFDRIGDDLISARDQYNAAKALDEKIFGDEFEAV